MSTERTTEDVLRIGLIVLAVLLVFPLLMMAFAAPMMGMMGWGWGGRMTGGVSLLWGVGVMVVWLAVLLGIGYLFYRLVAGTTRRSGASDRALEELRVAYARGDLTEEEFEERKATLQRENSP